MTVLEIIGAASLLVIAGSFVGRLIKRASTPELNEFETAVDNAMRDAFNAGMLCAADMVTMQGYDETAGKIRKVVEYATKAHNDND